MTLAITHPLAWIDDELAELDARGLRRELGTYTGAEKVALQVEGRTLVNFGSNDYLGLAGDARLVAAAVAATAREGCGAGASPLVTGRTHAQAALEARLAQFENTEAALVFPSGFAANLGTITALAGRGDTIFADERNHASMIDGCRLSPATVEVYPHRDWQALSRLLDRCPRGGRRLIVTESIFSMDGDAAPLVELADVAERYQCMLLVDEAHATGVFGQHGRGLSEATGVEDRVHVRIGTLSKALGSIGGFVAGSKSLVDWLANRARSYVFSTALPPAACGAAMAALDIIRDEPARRGQLLARATSLANSLRARGWPLGLSESPIIPLIVGQPQAALNLANSLAMQGLLVPAIRPPSVGEGESRLRISVSHAHSSAMIEHLLVALDRSAANL